MKNIKLTILAVLCMGILSNNLAFALEEKTSKPLSTGIQEVQAAVLSEDGNEKPKKKKATKAKKSKKAKKQ
ncbi:MAG: hypothetical protein HYY52_07165 [Candidatus Melainabacteria bacterium]|nr:hypothetical protein [Candidatus Melainabacteria bacterium]